MVHPLLNVVPSSIELNPGRSSNETAEDPDLDAVIEKWHANFEQAGNHLMLRGNLAPLLEYASKRAAEHTWAIQHNSFINQLLYQAEYTEQSFTHRVQTLRKQYIGTFPDSLITNFKFFSNTNSLDRNFFFFTSSDQQLVIILERNFYAANILGQSKEIISWNSAFLFRAFNFRGPSINSSDRYNYSLERINKPEEAFESFPLLINRYRVESSKNLAADFLTLLPWGNQFSEYLRHFEDALKQCTYEDKKCVDIEDFCNLITIFDPLWENDEGMKLTLTHRDQIMDHYQHELSGDQPRQARLLLVLSLLFTRYSSKYVFGTEHDSPFPLRQYALALLNSAYELDQKLLGEHSQALIEDWRNSLINIRNSCGACPAMLYDDSMMETVYALIIVKKDSPDPIDPILRDIFIKFVPSVWL